MRKALIALLLAACSQAFCQSVIRSLAWEVDTARPAVKEWPLIRGETVDLECRYLSGASAMDVRGAAVVLHCRTNGMPADLSFQVTGRVGRVSSTNLASVGWVTMRLRPDLDLPPDAARCTFVIETTLASARNLVATGLLRLSGDPTGASPAALPIFQYDAKGSAQDVSNALAGALQDLSGRVDALPPPPVASVNGSTGAVTITAASLSALTSETDPVAGPRLELLEAGTNDWRQAWLWGDQWRIWLATNTYVRAEQDTAALAALATHSGRTDNPHGVTAAQLGALTSESDAMALQALSDYSATNTVLTVRDSADENIRWTFHNGVSLGTSRLSGSPYALHGGSFFAKVPYEDPAERFVIYDIGDGEIAYIATDVYGIMYASGTSYPKTISFPYDVYGLQGEWIFDTQTVDVASYDLSSFVPSALTVTVDGSSGSLSSNLNFNTGYGPRITTLENRSVSATIMTPVTPSATVVAVTATQSYYRVTLSSTSVVSNDVSALPDSGTNSSWTLELFIVSTNAWGCSVVGVPECDVTVPGSYVFACSYADGALSVRQTYPSRFPWLKLDYYAGGESYNSWGYAVFLDATAFSTSAICFFNPYQSSKYVVVRNGIGSLAGDSYGVACTIGIDCTNDVGTTASNYARSNIVMEHIVPPMAWEDHKTLYTIIKRSDAPSGGSWLYAPPRIIKMWSVGIVGNRARIQFGLQDVRPATELEIQAFERDGLRGWMR